MEVGVRHSNNDRQWVDSQGPPGCSRDGSDECQCCALCCGKGVIPQISQTDDGRCHWKEIDWTKMMVVIVGSWINPRNVNEIVEWCEVWVIKVLNRPVAYAVVMKEMAETWLVGSLWKSTTKGLSHSPRYLWEYSLFGKENEHWPEPRLVGLYRMANYPVIYTLED